MGETQTRDDDENKSDRNERDGNVNSDASDYAQSDNEYNVEIDGGNLANSTESIDEGSNTQSIVKENSQNMDSLIVENGSNLKIPKC